MSCLAPALVDALRTRYGLEIDAAEPLLDGYDMWAESWRLNSSHGPLVLRADRLVTPATASWIADVIRHAADAGVPCAPPLPARDGTVAFRTGRTTVTLTRFIAGRAVDREDPAQISAAGATLGLLHHAFAGQHSSRPVPSPWDARFWSAERDPPSLQDTELDDWHQAFNQNRAGPFAHGVIHGDFYAGNLIWAGERVAAVIDWAETRIDAFARELAWSTWEFGHDGASQQLDSECARAFLAAYRTVWGPWEPGLHRVLIPLMRIELRRHARYSLANPGDVEHHSALRRAFAALRDQPAAALLDP